MLVCNENSKEEKSVVSTENRQISIFDLGITGVKDTKLSYRAQIGRRTARKKEVCVKENTLASILARTRVFSHVFLCTLRAATVAQFSD